MFEGSLREEPMTPKITTEMEGAYAKMLEAKTALGEIFSRMCGCEGPSAPKEGPRTMIDMAMALNGMAGDVLGIAKQIYEMMF